MRRKSCPVASQAHEYTVRAEDGRNIYQYILYLLKRVTNSSKSLIFSRQPRKNQVKTYSYMKVRKIHAFSLLGTFHIEAFEGI